VLEGDGEQRLLVLAPSRQQLLRIRLSRRRLQNRLIRFLRSNLNFAAPLRQELVQRFGRDRRFFGFDRLKKESGSSAIKSLKNTESSLVRFITKTLNLLFLQIHSAANDKMLREHLRLFSAYYNSRRKNLEFKI
jgi:hypothetical protein